MNGGGLSSNGEPATTPVYSATNGGWNSGTGVFTPTSGNPSLTVTVGDWAHVFTDGSTTPTRIARVTGVNSTTVTLSTTAGAGTAPTTAGTGISINVGGAWAGPSGSVTFPFGFVTGSMSNSTGNVPRFNFKNDQTHNVTASLAHSNNNTACWQGYSSVFGDGGKITFDAGGSAIVIINNTGQGQSGYDIIATNNSTNLKGIIWSGNRGNLFGLVAHNIGGIGIETVGNSLYNSEAYNCNTTNTASGAGIACGIAINCIAHGNLGSNTAGIRCSYAIGCIAYGNGSHGIFLGTSSNNMFYGIGNDTYANGGDGIFASGSSCGYLIRNCNLLDNNGWGIGTNNVGSTNFLVQNCGFGSGAMANGSGEISSISNSSNLTEVGRVTYGSGLTPWNDPANGDFRIALAAAFNTGYEQFTQTEAGQSGTIGYPDIGAATHQAVAGGGGNKIIGS